MTHPIQGKPRKRLGATSADRLVQAGIILDTLRGREGYERIVETLGFVPRWPLGTVRADGKKRSGNMSLPDLRAWASAIYLADDTKRQIAGETVAEIRRVAFEGTAVHEVDRVPGLRLLAQAVGVLVEKREVTGKDGGPIRVENLTDEQLDTLIRRLAGGGAPAAAGGEEPAG